ncbi:uncharacterized protein LOC113492261 [Trichoplusia ni]|uniref:Uncharacterized protein LOC113492261 n=1 Tax=Trichoplusia ni TaxID=7111 RepID=A0A7E5VB39_TRINI|nr:uncharacterized protein LOC113492261 [Trichoplusia ni]
MRTVYLLLLVSLFCLVSAKYLPDEGSSRALLRKERSVSEDSTETIESGGDDDNDEKDDDEEDEDEGDSSERKLIEKQIKQQEKREKEERKRLEKERKQQEKLEEQQQKLQEKLEKEQRKLQEKLEKEARKRQEEEQKRQEKLAKEERKQKEKEAKRLAEIEKKTAENSKPVDGISAESAEDNESIDLEAIWQHYVYTKYGVPANSSDLVKDAAINSYLKQELGLNANSSKTEYRQAVLLLVQNRLLNDTASQDSFRNYLKSHINAVYIQKISTEIENKIAELDNDTALLRNVSLPWAVEAQQAIKQEKSILSTIVQFLSNAVPSWLTGGQSGAASIVGVESNNGELGIGSATNRPGSGSLSNVAFMSEIIPGSVGLDASVPNDALPDVASVGVQTSSVASNGIPEINPNGNPLIDVAASVGGNSVTVAPEVVPAVPADSVKPESSLLDIGASVSLPILGDNSLLDVNASLGNILDVGASVGGNSATVAPEVAPAVPADSVKPESSLLDIGASVSLPILGDSSLLDVNASLGNILDVGASVGGNSATVAPEVVPAVPADSVKPESSLLDIGASVSLPILGDSSLLDVNASLGNILDVGASVGGNSATVAPEVVPAVPADSVKPESSLLDIGASVSLPILGDSSLLDVNASLGNILDVGASVGGNSATVAPEVDPAIPADSVKPESSLLDIGASVSLPILGDNSLLDVNASLGNILDVGASVGGNSATVAPEVVPAVPADSVKPESSLLDIGASVSLPNILGDNSLLDVNASLGNILDVGASVGGNSATVAPEVVPAVPADSVKPESSLLDIGASVSLPILGDSSLLDVNASLGNILDVGASVGGNSATVAPEVVPAVPADSVKPESSLLDIGASVSLPIIGDNSLLDVNASLGNILDVGASVGGNSATVAPEVVPAVPADSVKPESSLLDIGASVSLPILGDSSLLDVNASLGNILDVGASVGGNSATVAPEVVPAVPADSVKPESSLLDIGASVSLPNILGDNSLLDVNASLGNILDVGVSVGGNSATVAPEVVPAVPADSVKPESSLLDIGASVSLPILGDSSLLDVNASLGNILDVGASVGGNSATVAPEVVPAVPADSVKPESSLLDIGASVSLPILGDSSLLDVNASLGNILDVGASVGGNSATVAPEVVPAVPADSVKPESSLLDIGASVSLPILGDNSLLDVNASLGNILDVGASVGGNSATVAPEVVPAVPADSVKPESSLLDIGASVSLPNILGDNSLLDVNASLGNILDVGASVGGNSATVAPEVVPAVPADSVKPESSLLDIGASVSLPILGDNSLLDVNASLGNILDVGASVGGNSATVAPEVAPAVPADSVKPESSLLDIGASVSLPILGDSSLLDVNASLGNILDVGASVGGNSATVAPEVVPAVPADSVKPESSLLDTGASVSLPILGDSSLLDVNASLGNILDVGASVGGNSATVAPEVVPAVPADSVKPESSLLDIGASVSLPILGDSSLLDVNASLGNILDVGASVGGNSATVAPEVDPAIPADSVKPESSLLDIGASVSLPILGDNSLLDVNASLGNILDVGASVGGNSATVAPEVVPAVPADSVKPESSLLDIGASVSLPNILGDNSLLDVNASLGNILDVGASVGGNSATVAPEVVPAVPADSVKPESSLLDIGASVSLPILGDSSLLDVNASLGNILDVGASVGGNSATVAPEVVPAVPADSVKPESSLLDIGASVSLPIIGDNSLLDVNASLGNILDVGASVGGNSATVAPEVVPAVPADSVKPESSLLDIGASVSLPILGDSSLLDVNASLGNILDVGASVGGNSATVAPEVVPAVPADSVKPESSLLDIGASVSLPNILGDNSLLDVNASLGNILDVGASVGGNSATVAPEVDPAVPADSVKPESSLLDIGASVSLPILGDNSLLDVNASLGNILDVGASVGGNSATVAPEVVPAVPADSVKPESSLLDIGASVSLPILGDSSLLDVNASLGNILDVGASVGGNSATVAPEVVPAVPADSVKPESSLLDIGASVSLPILGDSSLLDVNASLGNILDVGASVGGNSATVAPEVDPAVPADSVKPESSLLDIGASVSLPILGDSSLLDVNASLGNILDVGASVGGNSATVAPEVDPAVPADSVKPESSLLDIGASVSLPILGDNSLLDVNASLGNILDVGASVGGNSATVAPEVVPAVPADSVKPESSLLDIGASVSLPILGDSSLLDVNASLGNILDVGASVGGNSATVAPEVVPAVPADSVKPESSLLDIGASVSLPILGDSSLLDVNASLGNILDVGASVGGNSATVAPEVDPAVPADSVKPESSLLDIGASVSLPILGDNSLLDVNASLGNILDVGASVGGNSATVAPEVVPAVPADSVKPESSLLDIGASVSLPILGDSSLLDVNASLGNILDVGASVGGNSATVAPEVVPAVPADSVKPESSLLDIGASVSLPILGDNSLLDVNASLGNILDVGASVGGNSATVAPEVVPAVPADSVKPESSLLDIGASVLATGSVGPESSTVSADATLPVDAIVTVPSTNLAPETGASLLEVTTQV